VATTKAEYPEKLRDDCIVEAICELRFDTSELAEVVVGRLTDAAPWKSFSQHRLPFADVPAPIRGADVNLKFQPILELRNDDSSRLVRVGPNVLSYHLAGKYCGWKLFQPELEAAVNPLFSALQRPEVLRVGFRYLNVFVPARHYVSSVHELNLEVQVAGTKLAGPTNLNFLVQNDRDHATLTRVASPFFVQGMLPPDTAVIVDIDVFSPPQFRVAAAAAVVEWIDAAHNFEKAAFFRLVPNAVLAKLQEA
jgi:uncharacterized protein (TIGR04255 family)